NGIYRKPLAQIPALLDGIAEYHSQTRFAGGFCSDWMGDLIVGGARNASIRRFELSADGKAATHKGLANLQAVHGLDVAVGPDGTIYSADFTAGRVVYIKPVDQPDAAAPDFFRFCDVSEQSGGWDVPSKPAALPIGADEYAASVLRV